MMELEDSKGVHESEDIRKIHKNTHMFINQKMNNEQLMAGFFH